MKSVWLVLLLAAGIPAFAATNKVTLPGPVQPSLDFSYESLLQLTSLKKDPFAASIYSLVYSGAGQFYAGNYTLGSLLFLGESLYHLFNIGIRYKLQNDYGTSVPFDQLRSQDKVLLISAFFGFVALKVYSVYEANISVRKFNQGIDQKLQKIQFKASRSEVSALYTFRF